jgi:hypothetical protein
MPFIVVEGGPPTDITRNARLVEDENADFEKKRRESMMRQLQQALREPQTGEQRFIGTVDKVECSGSTMSALIGTANGPLKFKIVSPKDLALMVFTPDAGQLRFGCGESFPNLKAVVTFLPSADNKKYAGDLKALEFVPQSFSLP